VTLKAKGGGHQERYLAPEARAAVSTWVKGVDIHDGAVFRRLESRGRVGERTITSAEVARTFKRIAEILDLHPGRPVSRISAHSTRIGATRDLTMAGAALPEIMSTGGSGSPQMPAHYSRKLDAGHGAMQRWLESARKREAGEKVVPIKVRVASDKVY
jgi:hypothetical protein